MDNETKDWPQELLDLFEDPLLENVKPKPAAITTDDRIQKKIDDLRAWIKANGREPDHKGKTIQEKVLAKSLQTLKESGLWI